MHTLATCKVLYHSMHTTVKAGTQRVGVALLVNNDKILYVHIMLERMLLCILV